MVEMSNNNQAQMNGKISGKGFLIGLSLFFGTVFLANGIMVYYALSTFDGVETDNAYRKGRAYNHVLEADAVQQALGWQVSIETMPSYTPDAIVLNIAVTLVDRESVALDLPSLPISFWRPTVQGMDRATILTPVSPGKYVGQLELAQPGNWISRINTATPDGLPFVHEERLFIPPVPTQTTP